MEFSDCDSSTVVIVALNAVKLQFYTPAFYILCNVLYDTCQVSIRTVLNFKRFYVPGTPRFFPNLHFILIVLTMEMYAILCFIVQFLRFLTQGNGVLPSALQNGCV
jgi:hypothetical protein